MRDLIFFLSGLIAGAVSKYCWDKACEADEMDGGR